MEDLDMSKVILRKPNASDGSEIWKLVKLSQSLDANSVYSYIMLSDMFKETCCIAEHDGRICGFVSAFRKPEENKTLFVWQIAVDARVRNRGIGVRLVKELLMRRENLDIQYIEATISATNLASKKLFIGLANELKTTYEVSKGYDTSLFIEGHEQEWLYRIGSFHQTNLED